MDGWVERWLYLHGSLAGRGLGTPAVVSVGHVDGLVAARSVFAHGVNHRGAVIHGTPPTVTGPAEKREGLRRLTGHSAPGQWSYARRPNRSRPPPPSSPGRAGPGPGPGAGRRGRRTGTRRASCGDPARLSRTRGHTVRGERLSREETRGWAVAPRWSRI
ncbi:pyridoxamine 5'-phosphate oxidase family protein [Streptomyces sp. NPDC006314]|uniref:pyridoxamine 5'-phosphate oxidase family protein n=1 Tax=Streptomyces sp. NPDC006314 TaxID=3154475 RepID=UPI0033BE4A5F